MERTDPTEEEDQEMLLYFFLTKKKRGREREMTEKMLQNILLLLPKATSLTAQ